MPRSDDALASSLKTAVESVVRDGKPMSHVTELLNKLRSNHGIPPIRTHTGSQRLAKSIMNAISFINNNKSKLARLALFYASVALMTHSIQELVDIDKKVRDETRVVDDHLRFTNKKMQNKRRNNAAVQRNIRYITGQKFKPVYNHEREL